MRDAANWPTQLGIPATSSPPPSVQVTVLVCAGGVPNSRIAMAGLLHVHLCLALPSRTDFVCRMLLQPSLLPIYLVAETAMSPKK